jgi:DNA-binding winged helix-turn-helix (wHTH) protein/TolB-like protein
MDDGSTALEVGTGRLQLGSFVLDMNARELLTSEGQLAGLRKQALDVLLVLGSRAGQVVSKDELMHRVWPRVVVGEGSLTQAIADIRRVLGDNEHRVVRNVARRGYLLVTDPILEAGPSKSNNSLPAGLPATTAAAVGHGGRRWPMILFAAGVAGWLGWFSFDRLPVDAARDGFPARSHLGPVSMVVLPPEVEGDVAAGFPEVLLDDLIMEVGRLGTSAVIARQTAQTYKGRSVDPREVARELRVRYVVQGRLRSEEANLQLSLVLIDGDTGAHRWSEKFIVERARLNQALDEFVIKLARYLQVEVIRSAGARVADLSPAAVTAEDLNMQGRSIWYRGFNPQNLVQALALFEQAVALDRDSPAWAGIAIMSILGGENGWLPDRKAAFNRVEAASENLNRIDPESFSAMQVKTMVAAIRKDRPATLRLSKAWSERYPQAISLGGYGSALLFNGRAEDAIAPLEQALRLSPRDVFRAEWQYRLAMAYFVLGRYEQAREWALTGQLSNPGLPWPPVHAAAEVRLGRTGEGKQLLDAFLMRHPGYEASRIAERLDASDLNFIEGRARLIASLRKIGLP